MKSLIAFWKHDIINKLIVIVLLALAASGGAIAWLFINMPKGMSVNNAFSEMLASATPTFDLNSMLTKSALTTGPASAAPVPTFFSPTLAFPTASPTLAPTASLVPLPTVTPMATVLPKNTVAPTGTPAPLGPLDAACVPGNETHTGRVVEVLDGNTARILIDRGLVYVVRYIGVATPENKIYAEAARQKNSELVYGKEVTLVEDASSKDDRGRLLRYVVAGGVFINLEMIKQGFGSALDSSPNSSCAQVFTAAEQSARTSVLGMWNVATP